LKKITSHVTTALLHSATFPCSYLSTTTGLSARAPECQKLKMVGIDQYDKV